MSGLRILTIDILVVATVTIFDVVEVDELTTGFLCDDDTVIVYVRPYSSASGTVSARAKLDTKSTIKMRNRGKSLRIFCLLFIYNLLLGC